MHHEVEVFLRQVAGFLNTTNRISRIVNRVEVFLRQSAGFLSTTRTDTTNRASRTLLRFSSGRLPVSSAQRTEHIEHRSTRTVADVIEDYEVISKLETCDSGESSGTREARIKIQDTYPASSGQWARVCRFRAIDEKCTTHYAWERTTHHAGEHTNRHAAPTWLRFSSGRLPVSSAPRYEHQIEVFLRQSAGFLNTTI